MANLLLMPAPLNIERRGGTRKLAADRTIILFERAVDSGMRGALDAQAALERYAGVRWEVRAASAIAEREGVVAAIDARAVRHRDGYHLTVGEERIAIVAHDAPGLYYGFATLVQLLRQFGRRLPLLHIEDQPRFAHRGVMLDVSRDRVPKMESLYSLVDMLAGWKVNQFQLYMEHTFAYERHRAVWKDASPFTGEEILALDAYCRERHIELVPNQNSFGHMSRWLEKKPYNNLAEAPRGTTLPWGKLPPFSLDPADPRSLRLLDELYGELLPHFASRSFNTGCDETFDLGRGKSAQAVADRGAGRVYLDFLLQVHKLCGRHGRKMMFWGDIVLQHPELIAEIPRDVTALDWGYEHDHPFDRETKAFRRAGLPYYVCPGSGGWNSFLGRATNTIANIDNAVTNASKRGAAGVLVTEWGDNGHMQPPPVAWLGMLYGAAMSWSPEASAGVKLERALSLHAFDDPSGVTGRAVRELGEAYTINGALTRNGSLLSQLFFLPLDNEWPMQRVRAGGFEDTLAYLDAASAPLDASHMRRGDARQVADEFAIATELARAGAIIGATKQARHDGAPPSRLRAGWRRAAKRIEAAIPEYERVWALSSRPGGLRDSAGRLHATAAALRQAAQ